MRWSHSNIECSDISFVKKQKQCFLTRAPKISGHKHTHLQSHSHPFPFFLSSLTHSDLIHLYTCWHIKALIKRVHLRSLAWLWCMNGFAFHFSLSFSLTFQSLFVTDCFKNRPASQVLAGHSDAEGRRERERSLWLEEGGQIASACMRHEVETGKERREEQRSRGDREDSVKAQSASLKLSYILTQLSWDPG